MHICSICLLEQTEEGDCDCANSIHSSQWMYSSFGSFGRYREETFSALKSKKEYWITSRIIHLDHQLSDSIENKGAMITFPAP